MGKAASAMAREMEEREAQFPPVMRKWLETGVLSEPVVVKSEEDELLDAMSKKDWDSEEELQLALDGEEAAERDKEKEKIKEDSDGNKGEYGESMETIDGNRWKEDEHLQTAMTRKRDNEEEERLLEKILKRDREEEEEERNENEKIARTEEFTGTDNIPTQDYFGVDDSETNPNKLCSRNGMHRQLSRLQEERRRKGITAAEEYTLMDNEKKRLEVLGKKYDLYWHQSPLAQAWDWPYPEDEGDAAEYETHFFENLSRDMC
jgi:hypothetical protein